MGKQFFLRRASWCRGHCYWLWTFGLVHSLHQHEHHKCDDQEVDDRHDETAISKDCTASFISSCDSRVIPTKIDEQATKINATHEKADDWVDQVSHEAAHDCRERGTDDDTNSHVHDIAFGDKVFEFVDHNSPHILYPCGIGLMPIARLRTPLSQVREKTMGFIERCSP